MSLDLPPCFDICSVCHGSSQNRLQACYNQLKPLGRPAPGEKQDLLCHTFIPLCPGCNLWHLKQGLGCSRCKCWKCETCLNREYPTGPRGGRCYSCGAGACWACLSYEERMVLECENWFACDSAKCNPEHKFSESHWRKTRRANLAAVIDLPGVVETVEEREERLNRVIPGRAERIKREAKELAAKRAGKCSKTVRILPKPKVSSAAQTPLLKDDDESISSPLMNTDISHPNPDENTFHETDSTAIHGAKALLHLVNAPNVALARSTETAPQIADATVDSDEDDVPLMQRLKKCTATSVPQKNGRVRTKISSRAKKSEAHSSISKSEAFSETLTRSASDKSALKQSSRKKRKLVHGNDAELCEGFTTADISSKDILRRSARMSHLERKDLNISRMSQKTLIPQ